MPTAFDKAFQKVQQLVADFRANEKFYLSPAYQEQEARHDFIDKFWLALGWDLNHETQKNPFEQEVKVERKEHGFSQRRADYAFYLAPNFRDVKFYVEAKKPHGDIATADNYFQTIRYGWSGKTKIAVLHDFEQFEILDSRFEPKIETVLSRNIREFHFHDYEDSEKFAEIYWLFSREVVASGSLEKFAATLPKKRSKGIEPGDIDEKFLKHLERYHYSWDGTYISYGDWLAEARTPEFFFNPKLAIRKIIARKLVATFIGDDIVLDQSIYVAIAKNGDAPDLHFLLGVLSSSIGGWYNTVFRREIERNGVKITYEAF